MGTCKKKRIVRRRFRAGFRLLWQTYTDPVHAAVLELYLAARQDLELREALRALSQRHHGDVRRRANEYFPNLARREASGLLESLLAVMTGLALRRAAFGDQLPEEPVLALIERMVTETFIHPRAGEKSA